MENKNEREPELRKQSRILLILALFLLVAVTAGVSYAFFNYTRLGTTENTITTGTITFLYDEQEAEGNGIQIIDALPLSDENGKALTGTNNVFDFRILATTTGNNISLPYEITARKKLDSDTIDDVVKLYLVEISGNSEVAAPLTMDGMDVKTYSDLTQTTVGIGEGITEKTIYQGMIPANSTNYEKNFRLRMWISDEADYSPVQDEEGNDTYPMNNKKFTVTVNVYANATVVTAGE